MLGESALAAVWDEVTCPYLAYWSVGGEIGLIMDDLSPFLLPDVRTPLSEDEEELLLAALAGLHARFWSSPALDLPWLARAEQYAGLLDAAVRHLPTAIAAGMTRPATEVARGWSALPRTLLHGDVKVANFAIMPSRTVAAFDWAMVGSGPATIDVGWYLGVNASRLARPTDHPVDLVRGKNGRGGWSISRWRFNRSAFCPSQLGW